MEVWSPAVSPLSVVFTAVSVVVVVVSVMFLVCPSGSPEQSRG